MNTRNIFYVLLGIVIIAALLLAGVAAIRRGAGRSTVSASPGARASAAPGSNSAAAGNVRVDYPQANQVVSGELVVQGEARGFWFFEGVFPVKLTDSKGTVIATGQAHAQSEWTTTKLVPFEAKITVPSEAKGLGTLIVARDNPSGKPTLDESRFISVMLNQQQVQPSLPPTIVVRSFFGNSQFNPAADCTKVYPVAHTIPRTPLVLKAAIEQLLAGPTADEKKSGYITSINSGVKVLSANITADKEAKIDFSTELGQGVAGSCRVTAIRSQIEQTAKQFPAVSKVIISINGKTEGILQP
jgi:spore germination protein GerM